MDTLNQTTNSSNNNNQRGGNQFKQNPALREQLHTQGRTRQANVPLEAVPNGSLSTNNRGGSLNIQELYSHYQKNNMANSGRNA